MTNHKIKNQYLTPFRESINGLVATDQGLFIGDGGIMAKDAPRIEKPCEQCKTMMYCTAQRKICSQCRKLNEKIAKQQRDILKRAATLRGEKLASDQPAAF